MGRKRDMDDPNMGFWEYTYNKNSNLKTQTDEKDTVITYNYDSLNLVISKVAVGTTLSCGPPHRSQRAELPHWAPTSGVRRQSARLDKDVQVWVLESSAGLKGHTSSSSSAFSGRGVSKSIAINE